MMQPVITTPTTPVAAGPSTPPAIAEQRVSVLVGDRMCTSCAYNLTGQPVLREPHYGLLIVRCPECGTAASVQEYPLLGRWAGRWAMLLAALWVLVLILLWVAAGAGLFGWCMGASMWAPQRFSDHVSNTYDAVYQAQQQQQAAAGGITATPGGGAVYINGRMQYGWGGDFTDWWKAQDHAALFRDAGGWLSGVDWQALVLWIPLAFTAILAGVLWSVVMLGSRRRAMLIWGLVQMLSVCIFASMAYAGWLWDDPRWAHEAAIQVIAPRIMAASLVVTAVFLGIGLVVGRPVARGIIRLLLPPRLRGSLAALWIADGLTPPVPSVARNPAARF